MIWLNLRRVCLLCCLLVMPLSAQEPPKIGPYDAILGPADCPIDVMGSVEAWVKVYYIHESLDNHGYYYTISSDIEIITNDTYYVYADGSPVAYEWFATPYGIPSKNLWTKVCGDLPGVAFPLFEDGFETGDTSAWDKVVGDG
jgi:hypothetical protein